MPDSTKHAQGRAHLREYFCSRPFEFATVNDLGRVYLCCPGWLDEYSGVVGDESFEAVWNSAAAQEMRQSILSGSYHHCNENCPYIRIKGVKLQRRDEVTDPFYRRIIDEQLTVLPVGPKEVTVSHDPTCNLSCPSCRRGMFKHDAESRQRSSKINEIIFGQALKNAHTIEICGNGDPFASPLYLQALREFDRERYPNLRIKMVTNGLRLDERMWNSIAKSHHVFNEIHISFNGATRETFAINQRGGDLDTLLENMEFISGLRESGAIPYMSLGFYVLDNNFHEMGDFVDLTRRFKPDAIFYSPMTQSMAITDEEYGRAAVHRPSHPRFREFLLALNDPRLNALGVGLINLSYLLFYHFAANEFREPAAPEDVSTLGMLRRSLELEDHQLPIVKEHLDRQKRRMVQILSRPAVGGGRSPISQALDHETEKRFEVLNTVAGEQVDAVSSETYWKTILSEGSRDETFLFESLTVKQRILWDLCGYFRLLNCDTGYAPLLDVLFGPGGEETSTEPAATLTTITSLLGESPATEVLESIRLVIDDLKDSMATLYSRESEDGPAPLERFADDLLHRPHLVAADFVAHLAATCPRGGSTTYAEQTHRLNMAAHEKIVAMLPLQHPIRVGDVPDWSACHTGHDPFTLALEAVLARRALIASH